MGEHEPPEAVVARIAEYTPQETVKSLAHAVEMLAKLIAKKGVPAALPGSGGEDQHPSALLQRWCPSPLSV